MADAIRELHEGPPLFVRGTEAGTSARVLAAKEPRCAIDRDALKDVSSLKMQLRGRTPFEGVRRVAAWHTASGTCAWRVPAQGPRRDPREHAARSWAALVDSIRGLGAKRFGVLLSGGIDSATIAAAAVASGAKPVLLTWTFPGLGCDESAPAQAVAEHLGCPWRGIDATRFEIGSRLEEYLRERDDPLIELLEPAARESLRVAREEGCDAVLTGFAGDDVLTGTGYEVDLIRQGSIGQALKFQSGIARAVSSSVLHVLAGGLRAAVARRPRGVTGEARKRLGSWAFGRLERALTHESLLWRGELAAGWGRSAGVRVVHPYLHRAFLDVVLSADARTIFAGEQAKPLTRRMAAGRLPESIVTRDVKTHFHPFFESVLGREEPAWRRMAREAGLERVLDRAVREPRSVVFFWLSLAAFQFEQQWEDRR